MDHLNLHPYKKFCALNDAVLTKSPAEAAEIFKALGEVEITGYALGNAFRCRGLEMVRVLVEGGARLCFTGYSTTEMRDLCYSEVGYNPLFSLLMLEKPVRGCYRRVKKQNASEIKPDCPFPRPSSEEREKTLEYLYENREKAAFDPGELLYYAYFAGDLEMIKMLKRLGAAFPEKYTKALTGQFGKSIPFEWWEFCEMCRLLPDGEFIGTMSSIAAEAGGTLHFTNALCIDANERRFYTPEVFRFFMENFNQSKMNKTQIMKGIIQRDSVECLETAAAHGWLKPPKKRDEMIKFASENSRTECTAWLLDYKNRTADFAAEREKAEKKLLRELNADPNSVTELRKIWSFEKLGDETLKITSYKGRRTEAEVPEKIGKSAVTSIGAYAFSCYAPRLKFNAGEFRKTITKITLPDSVNHIGENAFECCMALKSVNIPNGVSEIPTKAFTQCYALEAVEIPESVQKIGRAAFAVCKTLKNVKIPDGVSEIASYTFSACKSLDTVKIPESVQKIGEGAFQSCNLLKKVVIPEGVTELERWVFRDCGALETVELPASLAKIKNRKEKGSPAETIFDKAPNVTAIVTPKSYAEKYCKRYEIKYAYKGDI